jgi:LNS2 (Lipin/Ned1/Smp2)
MVSYGLAVLLAFVFFVEGEPPKPAGPVPALVVPGAKVSWNRSSTSMFTVPQGSPNHRCEDRVLGVGAPVPITCKFAYGPADKDLKGEDVEVWRLQAPAGPWVNAGAGRTTKDDEHPTEFGIPDDGGRLYFSMPEFLPLGANPVKVSVKGDHSQACGMVYVVESGTPAVVFDIDGTLTISDSQVFKELFDKLLEHKYVPKAWPGALRVVNTWVSRGYLPVYITGRPGILKQLSLEWLKSQGYPPGPLFTTWDLNQSMPTVLGVAKYKMQLLGQLKTAGLVIAAAYGNAATDVRAYRAAGFDGEQIFVIGPNGGLEGSQPVKSYLSHLEWLEKTGAPQVIGLPWIPRWCTD